MPRFAIIEKRTFFRDRSEDLFDSYTFHGIPSQRLLKEESQKDFHLPIPPLSVRRSLPCPSVTMPSTSLVVDDACRRHVSSIPNIKFERVDATVIEPPIRPERYDHLEQLWQRGSLLHAPDAVLWEIRTRRLIDVAKNYENRGTVGIRVEAFNDDNFQIEICANILEDYPIIWEVGVLCSSSAFEILAPHLDDRFFIVNWYSTP